MLVSFLFETISCSNPNISTPEEETTTDGEIQTSNVPISFDVTSLKGLAISTSSQKRSVSRSTTTVESLLKITDDGELKKFINIPSNDFYLSSINYITKSPSENSKEFYIVLEGQSYWYEHEEKTDLNGWTYLEPIQHYLGNILCVYEDGSFCDVLKDTNEYMSGEIKFDQDGNAVFLVDSHEKGDMIYKFNPKTKKLDKLVASISGTSYDSLYVTNKGDWIFVQGSRWSDGSTSYFLNAIPISNPNNASTIYYNDSWNSYFKWIYNENSREVYYIADYELRKIPYKGGTYNIENVETVASFKNLNNFNGDGYNISDSLFEYSSAYNYKIRGRAEGYDIEDDNIRYFTFTDSEGKNINYEEIVNYIFSKLRIYLKETRVGIETSGTYVHDGQIYYNEYENIDFREKYEIRFDVFANIPGFEKLASETYKNGAQLSDEKLFETIIEKDLLSLLGRAIISNRYSVENIYKTYNNNFFADILYEKGTNNKIDSTLFMKDETGFLHSVSIPWSTSVSYYSNYELGFLEEETYYTQYYWKEEFLTKAKDVDAEKVLAKFAELLGYEEIDFSLESFKDEKDYSDLYTDKTNVEAILFLSESVERINTLRTIIVKSCTDFFTKTCFIPGTKDSILENQNEKYYMYEYLDKLAISDKTLYGYQTSNNKIVQLTDDEGKAVFEYVKFDNDKEFKFSELLVYENKFYFKNSILSSSGISLGKHNIICFDPETSTFKEVLWDMPNNSDYEIVSYTIHNNNLYGCFVRGTEVIIGEINLETNDYKPVASSEAELKQIMMLK